MYIFSNPFWVLSTMCIWPHLCLCLIKEIRVLTIISSFANCCNILAHCWNSYYFHNVNVPSQYSVLRNDRLATGPTTESITLHFGTWLTFSQYISPHTRMSQLKWPYLASWAVCSCGACCLCTCFQVPFPSWRRTTISFFFLWRVQCSPNQLFGIYHICNWLYILLCVMVLWWNSWH